MGPALFADLLWVGRNVVLIDLKATGHGENGAVRLLSAHIGGQLKLEGAELANNAGPALFADDLQVDSSAFLTNLTATGYGPLGVVRLPGAHFASQLHVSGSVSVGDGERVILDLCGARVEERFFLWNAEFWKGNLSSPPTERLMVRLDGVFYRFPPGRPAADTWLRVLRECMPAYVPQPYRQLAEVCRAAGDEPLARDVLIAQQDALGETLRRRGARVWHWITRVTVRYGYRTSRALWFLLVSLAASCVLILVAGTQGWLVHPAVRGGGRCGIVESVGSAVDRTAPLLGLGVVGRCELTNAMPAQWVFVAGLVLQMLNWAFISLFVAGFTGIVRKPST